MANHGPQMKTPISWKTCDQIRFCHAMEVRLEKEIREIDPENPVLIVYKDTFDAIDAYLAIK